MTARLARSLVVLRDQINMAHPDRDKSSDGWIAGIQHHHQNPHSDHEPNEAGVVTALDITHDPAHGVDTYVLADLLRTNRDPRIKYLISNSRIWSPQIDAFHWRPYHGRDPHEGHVHISVVADPKRYDATAEWALTRATPAPAPAHQQKNIIATVFAGGNERQASAYGGMVDPKECGVALPFRFVGARPKVRAYRNSMSVVCSIVDVGPWETDDRYWANGTRPHAETGHDRQGRKTNGAGIDLTPAAAKALGLNPVGDKAIIDWEFIT